MNPTKLTAILVGLFLALAVRIAAAADFLPEASLDHVLFAQISDTRIRDTDQLVGKRSFIWGATVGALGRGLYTSYYYPSNRDLDRDHTLQWYQEHKPEWVAYQCDRKTPAYDHKYSWGAYVPLDITREDVRKYILERFLIPAINKGYSAIAYDNVGITNSVHRCGVWQGSQWIQQYSGTTRDPRYYRAVLDYIGWVRHEVNARGAALAANIHVDAKQVELTAKLIDESDIWLDEGGFSNDCRHRVVDGIWRAKFQLASTRSMQGSFVSMNVLCTPYAQLDDGEKSWIVANFLLVRGPRSYLAVVGPGDQGTLLDYSSLVPQIGKPLDHAMLQNGIYFRPYENGLVLVNPSSTRSFTFRLPQETLKDMRGEEVSSTINVGPRSGIVLLK